MAIHGNRKWAWAAMAAAAVAVSGCQMCCPQHEPHRDIPSTAVSSGSFSPVTPRGTIDLSGVEVTKGQTVPIPELHFPELMASTATTNPTPGGLVVSTTQGGCCTSCGFISFNNNGAGYTAYKGQPFRISVSTNSNMYPLIETSQWCARWRYGGQPNQSGCFYVAGSTEQEFVAPITAQYAITVYIKANCPPAGTRYYLSTRILPP